MRTADFDFDLPPDLIAQHPADTRTGSRLLVLERESKRITHRHFPEITGYFQSGDVLVVNDSRVIPARLRAANQKTGGAFEILLLEENATNDWWAMVRPGKRARVGTELAIRDRRRRDTGIRATVLATNHEGHRRLAFSGTPNILNTLDELGELPLPPYIKREDQIASEEDRVRYQTVYANQSGSVAAPTAGLHFTPELLDEMKSRGVSVQRVTLHVGLGTFAPVKAERIEDHVMHYERYTVSAETAHAINAAKSEGRRVIAVGTTTVRVLESVAREHGSVRAANGRTNIFIYPPYTFRVVDALVTNFHLPQSTLLMLVSAFAAPGSTSGRETILRAYHEAVAKNYRFFSYGDAMLII